jgi:hypothetical protein
MVLQKGSNAMPMIRLFRPMLALGILALSGCVGAPVQMPPPGQAYFSSQCFAGFYQCVLPAPGQVGAPCSCPGLGAPSYGTIR